MMCKTQQSPNDKEIKIMKFIKLKHNEFSCGLLAAYIWLFPKQYIDTQTLFTQLCTKKEVVKSGCLLKVNIYYAAVLTYSGISYA